MASRIEYGFLKATEGAEFQNFIANHWASNHLFANDRTIFDWQHRNGSGYHVVVARDGGKLVGAQCAIPLAQYDRHLPKEQIFLSLWRVVEGHGIGIGLKLFETLKKHYSDTAIFSLGITPRALAFHRWQKFDLVDVMHHHVALNPQLNHFHIATVPADMQRQPLPIDPLIRCQKLTEADLFRLPTSTLYRHQQPIKSDSYLINRYFRHPTYQYGCYAVFEADQLLCLCVIRSHTEQGRKVLRMIDYCGASQAVPKIKSFLAQILNESGAEYLDLYSHGVPLTLLAAAGFIDRRTTPGLIIPSYFEPFVRQNIEIHCAYKVAKKTLPVRLFKGDGDQDRPNRP